MKKLLTGFGLVCLALAGLTGVAYANHVDSGPCGIAQVRAGGGYLTVTLSQGDTVVYTFPATPDSDQPVSPGTYTYRFHPNGQHDTVTITACPTTTTSTTTTVAPTTTTTEAPSTTTSEPTTSTTAGESTTTVAPTTSVPVTSTTVTVTTIPVPPTTGPVPTSTTSRPTPSTLPPGSTSTTTVVSTTTTRPPSGSTPSKSLPFTGGNAPFLVFLGAACIGSGLLLLRRNNRKAI